MAAAETVVCGRSSRTSSRRVVSVRIYVASSLPVDRGAALAGFLVSYKALARVGSIGACRNLPGARPRYALRQALCLSAEPARGRALAAGRGASETTGRKRAIRLYRYRRASRPSPPPPPDGVRRARRRRPRLEDVEGAHERRVDGHDRARVVELPTIIGRREQRDQLTLREELVAVLDDLRNS